MVARRESHQPVRMDRVALVMPNDRRTVVLQAVWEAGVVELEQVAPEASIREAEGVAVRREAVSAYVGWAPDGSLPLLEARLSPLGGAVVLLRPPRGSEPPTLVPTVGPTGAFQPLVDTYATIPYADINPALFAGLVYVVMFGMMFGDVAHGAILALGGVLLARGRPKALAQFTHLAPFVIGAGVAATVFGLLYGEAFGPTHLVPTIWMAPLDHPTTLLAVAVAVGAGLLAVAYGVGTANRWREGGPARALLATSGLAGGFVYLGLAAMALGWYKHVNVLLAFGGLLAAAGLVLGFTGCFTASRGVLQAVIELFDSVLRIGTNTVSFARLAAFGLTHAALCQVVWSGTTGLWHRGATWWVPAALLFVFGNAVAFGLEGLVAGIQALRLEYYELFSRIFVAEGRPFRPWHPARTAPPSEPIPFPLETNLEVPCSPG